ncbi:MAG TPA: DMT family transporter [Gaiellales bacterium]|nr:DMT family transporter [Gaiellales bacterium]
MTHDRSAARPAAEPGLGAPRTISGLGFALVSAASFGLSGTLARGLLDTGWSPGAVTLIRIGLAAALVAPFGLAALHGRWHLLGRSAGTILAYGSFAVAGAQFCYFSAVQYMQVAPALLIEYTAPVAVVLWLWLRHAQRPSRMTVLGIAVAILGLVLVVGLVSGTQVSVAGTLWALGAMVGCSVYFLLSADDGRGLPPLTLAAGGLVVGTALLGLLAVVGLLPITVVDVPAAYSGVEVAWWIPLLLLGLVTAAIAYTSGIAAIRRLGSRVSSFVGLTEVLAALGWAWLLLAELPSTVQLLGALLIVLGVVAVKLGERPAAAQPFDAIPPA